MGASRRMTWSSDGTLRLEFEGAGAARAAAACIRTAAIPGVADLVSAYTTLTVICDLRAGDAAGVERAVSEALSSSEAPAPAERRVQEIGVCYEGDFAPDLGGLASMHGLTPDDVVGLHAVADYTVEFLGFSPGFPYLSGLPERLATPRLEKPRTRVSAGSVGIGGSQTGVYPQATPGGWRLIGRTPLQLFDAGRSPPALLSAGDRVRFVPISREEFERRAREAETERREAHAAAGAPGVRILRAGMLSTVQDLGRPGHAAIGVTPAGAADEVSLRIGNRLVGNADGAAAIEMTLVGMEAELLRDATVALTGAAAQAVIVGSSGTRPLPYSVATGVRRGERVRVGRVTGGARAYLCIAGGIATRPVLGGRATHVASGLGGLDGRALREGDELPLGEPGTARAHADDPWRDLAAQTASRRTLRITPGPHTAAFDAAAMETLTTAEFTVADQSDRTGVRLIGPAIRPPHGGRMPTEGMPPGAIQITENGMPIVLGADRPTTGGYPVLACVAGVDLPALGQLAPRERVRFEPVSFAGARRLYHAFWDALDRALPPVRGPGLP